MPAIIIIDEMHSSIIAQLEQLDYDVDYQPEIYREQLKHIIGKYHGLVVRSKTIIDFDLLEDAQNLQFVARAGAGVDNLDENTLKEKGIHMINAPEGNRDSLGEHMMGMLLSLLHKIGASCEAIRSGQWDREGFRGTELGGKTVGIIGCGNMGNALASRLQSFGCQVLGYDKYLEEQPTSNYQRVPINQLFIRSDIVSLHVPLTEETRNFYNYSFFQQFKKPIILMNSARGEILPLKDLVKLLRERKIIGACLDVFEKEPLFQLSKNQKGIYDYLTDSPEVILTPHIAGWSYESYQRINDVLVTKIRALKQSGSID
ncbi:MAG: 2-hydroxyacid dehydrogenase [Cyclobacteriaceae bacterium]|nr:MAG: 2-hydroxyacid dehydrogenase [Cyclobacteriaceae bacterium]